MHKIDAPGHVNNTFAPGDPIAGTAPTRIDADWLNAMQGEIAHVITAADIDLEKGNNTQLLLAINALIDAKLQNFTGGSGVVSSGCPDVTVNADGFLVCDATETNTGGGTENTSNADGTSFTTTSEGDLSYISDGEYAPLDGVEFAIADNDLTATAEPTPTHIALNSGSIEVTES